MIVDTSALVAIVREEPEAMRALSVLLRDPSPRISAGNMLELYLVVDRRQHARLSDALDALLRRAELIVEPVTAAQVELARDAHRRYGKGSGHPARLNYGDCFAYALARERGEPLLFVGNDFARTDIVRVLDGDSG